MIGARILRSMVMAGTILAVAACGSETWLGANETQPLAGERISVLAHERSLQPSPEAAARLQLPRPRRNANWPQAGGYPHHAMHHLDLEPTIHRVWFASAGEGATSRDRLLATPIVGDGQIFVMDSDANVIAFNAKTGARKWTKELAPPEGMGDSLRSGGLAYDDGRIYATTGFGHVIAISATNGHELWRHPLWVPLRAPPTVSGDRVFAVNKDNELHVLSTEDGHELWSHSGILEIASLLGSPSPAVEAGVVVVGYSSGELFALRMENGGVLWSESLTAVRRSDPLSNMADIRGRPVIDRGRVYAVSHSGIMVAIDLRTGQRLWELEVGGTDQPWIAGDYLYVVSNESEVAAVEAKTGQIAWLTRLPKYTDPEERDERILWAGPVVAGDRLIVVGSHGKAKSISPYTGDILSEEEMPAGATTAPIVADGMIYFLTDEAELIAYK